MLAVMVALYATFDTPPGRVVGITVIVCQLTCKVYAWATKQPEESVAVTVKLNDPGTVGVPVRAPPELRLNPVGSDPAVLL